LAGGVIGFRIFNGDFMELELVSSKVVTSDSVKVLEGNDLSIEKMSDSFSLFVKFIIEFSKNRFANEQQLKQHELFLRHRPKLQIPSSPGVKIFLLFEMIEATNINKR